MYTAYQPKNSTENSSTGSSTSPVSTGSVKQLMQEDYENNIVNPISYGSSNGSIYQYVADNSAQVKKSAETQNYVNEHNTHPYGNPSSSKDVGTKHILYIVFKFAGSGDMFWYNGNRNKENDKIDYDSALKPHKNELTTSNSNSTEKKIHSNSEVSELSESENILTINPENPTKQKEGYQPFTPIGKIKTNLIPGLKDEAQQEEPLSFAKEFRNRLNNKLKKASELRDNPKKKYEKKNMEEEKSPKKNQIKNTKASASNPERASEPTTTTPTYTHEPGHHTGKAIDGEYAGEWTYHESNKKSTKRAAYNTKGVKTTYLAYDIAGPGGDFNQTEGGGKNAGPNSIETNVANALELLRLALDKHKNENSNTTVHLKVKGHSRGAVAANLFLAFAGKLLQSYKKNNRIEGYDSEIYSFDPVSGGPHSDKKEPKAGYKVPSWHATFDYAHEDFTDAAIKKSGVMYSASGAPRGNTPIISQIVLSNFVPSMIKGSHVQILSSGSHCTGLIDKIKMNGDLGNSETKASSFMQEEKNTGLFLADYDHGKDEEHYHQHTLTIENGNTESAKTLLKNHGNGSGRKKVLKAWLKSLDKKIQRRPKVQAMTFQ